MPIKKILNTTGSVILYAGEFVLITKREVISGLVGLNYLFPFYLLSHIAPFMSFLDFL